MIPVDRVELRVGESRWMRGCGLGAQLLALAAILVAPAPAGWRLAAGAAFGLVALGAMLRRPGSACSGTLVLQGDGDATLISGGRNLAGRHRGPAWVSRWFCVVPFDRLDGGARLHCIVCRCRNTRDDYRRLLVRLRFHSFRHGNPVGGMV